MSMLLLVRSAGDVRSAVEAASDVLVYRRRHFAEDRQEVLGIWLKRELEAGLPTWPSSCAELGTGVPVNSQAGAIAADPLGGEAAAGIRESFSLLGIWTLCCMDGAILREAESPRERRRRILDALLSTSAAARSSGEPGTFFPVFGATEASDSIAATMRELRERYPQLIGGTSFVDDESGGIVSERGAAG